MGGRLFAPYSERVTNEESEKVFNHLYKLLSKYFVYMEMSKSLKSKKDHGDLDIVVLPKNLNMNFKETLEKELDDGIINYSKNGYINSFLFKCDEIGKKVHVDFIRATSEEDYRSKSDYFSFNDFSAIVGMFSRKLNFKYTDGGFFKKFIDVKGNWHDFLISRNLMDGLKILGLNSSKFNNIGSQEDILNFVLESPLFDKKYFEYGDLVRRDKEAYDVRPDVKELSKKIIDSGKTRSIENDNHFFKKYFPQKYEEYLTEMDAVNKKVSFEKKYGGKWLMNKFGLTPGPELGKIIKAMFEKFGDNLENTSEEDVTQFVKNTLMITESLNVTYKDFAKVLLFESKITEREGEVFRFMNWRFDVDAALDLIKKKNITAIEWNVVKQYAEQVMSLDREKPDYEPVSFLVGLDYKHLKSLPPDRLAQAGIIATVRTKDRTVYQVVMDGNHRLAKNYMDGKDSMKMYILDEKDTKKIMI